MKVKKLGDTFILRFLTELRHLIRIPTLVVTGAFVGTVSIQCAFSDTTTTSDANKSSVSTKNETPVVQKITEKLGLTYWGVFNGGSLQNPLSTYQPLPDGSLDNSSPQGFENVITAGYRHDKNTFIGAVGHFYYFPSQTPVGQNQNFQLLDPALAFFKNNIIDSKEFSLSVRLYTFLPLSSFDYLLSKNLAGAVSPTAILNYQVPNSQLSVGLFTYIRGYIPTSNTPDDARAYRIICAPMANYQLTNTLSATLWIDLVQSTHYRNSQGYLSFDNLPVDIEPGLSWNITPNISINPILNIYPSNPSLAATSFKTYINAKAF